MGVAASVRKDEFPVEELQQAAASFFDDLRDDRGLVQGEHLRDALRQLVDDFKDLGKDKPDAAGSAAADDPVVECDGEIEIAEIRDDLTVKNAGPNIEIDEEGTKNVLNATNETQNEVEEVEIKDSLEQMNADVINERFPLNPKKAYYPLYVVQGATLHKLKRMVPHEEALKAGLLRRVLRVEDGKFSNRVLILKPLKKGGKEEAVFDTHYFFISHRWMSPSLNPDEAHPDDQNNTKLRGLKLIMNVKKYFWMDYLCIPQRNPSKQILAIQSLPYYAHCSARFSAIHVKEEGRDVYLSRLWCQAEIIASTLPLRMPYFNIQWVGKRGLFYDIRPLEQGGAGFHAKESNRVTGLELDHIRSPKECGVTDPRDCQKLLPLLHFAIEEWEAFLAWDALDYHERCRTKTFGKGKYRIDETPSDGRTFLGNYGKQEYCESSSTAQRHSNGKITSADIRALIEKLKSGVAHIEQGLTDLKISEARPTARQANVDTAPLPPP